MQILITCVSSVFARTAAVWYASDEMYVTAMHYIEAERAAGSTICLTDSPLETGKVDVLLYLQEERDEKLAYEQSRLERERY